jgi:hypothetical protein
MSWIERFFLLLQSDIIKRLDFGIELLYKEKTKVL